MKAYYGVDRATGKWYARSEIPLVTQWGRTAHEAQDKLSAYLEHHYGLTVVGWRQYPSWVSFACYEREHEKCPGHCGEKFIACMCDCSHPHLKETKK